MPDVPIRKQSTFLIGKVMWTTSILTLLLAAAFVATVMVSAKIYEFDSVISNTQRIHFQDADQDKIWDKKTEVRGNQRYVYLRVDKARYNDFEQMVYDIQKVHDPDKQLGVTPDGHSCLLVTSNLCSVLVAKGSPLSQSIQHDFWVGQLWSFFRD